MGTDALTDEALFALYERERFALAALAEVRRARETLRAVRAAMTDALTWPAEKREPFIELAITLVDEVLPGATAAPAPVDNGR
jgi:hypothetical protein